MSSIQIQLAKIAKIDKIKVIRLYKIIKVKGQNLLTNYQIRLEGEEGGNKIIFNVNNNNNKHEQHFVKIDKCIFEINNVITKICKEQVMKTIDDRRVDIITEGDIKCVYDTAIISVIHKFITISNECEKIYLKECAAAGIEAGKLR